MGFFFNKTDYKLVINLAIVESIFLSIKFVDDKNLDMIHQKIEDALNKQIGAEAASSQYYLAMASWAETQGYEGVANFFTIIRTRSVNTC